MRPYSMKQHRVTLRGSTGLACVGADAKGALWPAHADHNGMPEHVVEPHVNRVANLCVWSKRIQAISKQ